MNYTLKITGKDYYKCSFLLKIKFNHESKPDILILNLSTESMYSKAHRSRRTDLNEKSVSKQEEESDQNAATNCDTLWMLGKVTHEAAAAAVASMHANAICQPALKRHCECENATSSAFPRLPYFEIVSIVVDCEFSVVLSIGSADAGRGLSWT